MGKRTLQPGFTRFEHRHALGTQWGSLPAPRGMKRQGDFGRIPPDQFYWLQNMRISGSQVISRGGSEKVNAAAENGCITGIFDTGD